MIEVAACLIFGASLGLVFAGIVLRCLRGKR